MNKKGLATGIIVITAVLFLVAMSGLVSITMWSHFNTAVQAQDNETISQEVKDQIDDLSYIVLWSDKLFLFTVVALVIGFLISATTIPADQPLYLILYAGILLILTFVAMILSNGWTYLANNPNFVGALADMTLTEYIMKYYPVVIFFTGIAGGLIFYGRRQNDITVGGKIDGFE